MSKYSDFLSAHLEDAGFSPSVGEGGAVDPDSYYDNGSISGDYNVDVSTASIQTVQIIGTTDLSFINWPQTSTSITLEVVDGGSFILSWSEVIAWSNGIEPTMTVTGKDIIEMYTTNSGISVNAFLSGADVK